MTILNDNILFQITSVFFFVWVLRNIFFWIYLWQIKEYRFDRISIHLFEKVGFEKVGIKKNWLKTLHGWEDEIMLQKMLY